MEPTVSSLTVHLISTRSFANDVSRSFDCSSFHHRKQVVIDEKQRFQRGLEVGFCR